MTAQQITDQRRAHAASVALQAKIKRENAAHDARMEQLRQDQQQKDRVAS